MNDLTPTQREVWRALKTAGSAGLVGYELEEASRQNRYIARLHELKQKGYRWRKELVSSRPRRYRYFIVNEPAHAVVTDAARVAETEPVQVLPVRRSRPQSPTSHYLHDLYDEAA